MQIQDLGVTIYLSLIPILLFSLAVHEYAHALVASIFGDPTAKLEGRQTINPIAHWDPIGTTLLVGMLLLRALGAAVPVFGWGKPVPVNEDNFDNPRLHGLQVALAGPFSNFLLAILFALASNATASLPILSLLLGLAVKTNLFLMFFNLLPIPPLDGSRILRLFISDSLYFSISGNPVVFFMLIFFALSFLMGPISDLSSSLTQQLLTIGR